MADVGQMAVLDTIIGVSSSMGPLQLSSSGPLVRVQVADEGPGIPEEHRERIFGKFETVRLKKEGVPQVGSNSKYEPSGRPPLPVSDI